MLKARAKPRKDVQRPTGEGCCLFVMELGGRWPTWMPAPLASRVLVQTSRESAGAFASRVVRAIAAVCREGQSLESVVIAAGWVDDCAQVLLARSRITQAVAKAIDGGPGSIVLSAHDLCPEQARHELLSTAGALAAQLAASSIEIRVRFDARPLLRAASRIPDRDSSVHEARSATTVPTTRATRECDLATA